jgi:hypothetical protein
LVNLHETHDTNAFSERQYQVKICQQSTDALGDIDEVLDVEFETKIEEEEEQEDQNKDEEEAVNDQETKIDTVDS